MFRVRFFPAHCLTIFHPPEMIVENSDLFAAQLVFVWDRLVDPQVVEQLLGRPVPFAPALLPDHARTATRDGDDWNFEVREEVGEVVAGVALIGLTDEELDKLDDSEQVPIHRVRHKAKVRIGDLERVVDVYLRHGSYLEE